MDIVLGSLRHPQSVVVVCLKAAWTLRSPQPALPWLRSNWLRRSAKVWKCHLVSYVLDACHRFHSLPASLVAHGRFFWNILLKVVCAFRTMGMESRSAPLIVGYFMLIQYVWMWKSIEAEKPFGESWGGFTLVLLHWEATAWKEMSRIELPSANISQSDLRSLQPTVSLDRLLPIRRNPHQFHQSVRHKRHKCALALAKKSLILKIFRGCPESRHVQTTMPAHSASRPHTCLHCSSNCWEMWGELGFICCPGATEANGQVLVLEASVLIPNMLWRPVANAENILQLFFCKAFRTGSQFLSMNLFKLNVLATSGSVWLRRHILHATSSTFDMFAWGMISYSSGHKLVLGKDGRKNEAPALLASPMRSQYFTVSNDIPILFFPNLSDSSLRDGQPFSLSQLFGPLWTQWPGLLHDFRPELRVCPTKSLKYRPNPLEHPSRLRMQWTIQPCPVKKNCHDPKDAHRSNTSSLSIKTFHNDVPHFTTLSVIQYRTYNAQLITALYDPLTKTMYTSYIILQL